MNGNTGHDFSAYFKRAISPLMVLALLRNRKMYGYEISQEINLRTQKKLSIAVLYPVLYRLQGYIQVADTVVENGRARNYYITTKEGEDYLSRTYAEYQELSELFCGIVGGKNMSNKTVKNYCKKIGRSLRCTPSTRRTLLHGLAEELLALPDSERASMAALETHVGTVSQIAADLQESVPMEEVLWAVQAERRTKILVTTCVVVAAILLMMYGYYVFRYGPFYSVEVIHGG